MYAIVEICGKQYKVEKDSVLNVERINEPENSDVAIDKVLLYADGENVQVGQPYLSNVKVVAKLLGEAKDKKVEGIKFKKRKNYTRTLGHRHIYSQIKINELQLN